MYIRISYFIYIIYGVFQNSSKIKYQMKNLRTLAIGKFGLGFGKVRWSSISNYAQIIQQKKYQRSNMLKYLRTKTFSDSSGNFLSAVDLFVFASAQNNHGMWEFMPQAMTVDRSLCCFCKHLNPILVLPSQTRCLMRYYHRTFIPRTGNEYLFWIRTSYHRKNVIEFSTFLKQINILLCWFGGLLYVTCGPAWLPSRKGNHSSSMRPISTMQSP